MASNISFLCLIFFTFAAFDIAQAFDYFKLVQRWLPAYCRESGVTCQVAPIPKRFIIHGLWPENLKRRSPRPTPTPTDPSYATIPPGSLYDDMLHFWPDVQHDIYNQEFWKYEWNVHGKISSNMYNQAQYFQLAVNLVKQFPVRGWLSEKNIYANDGETQYTAQDISLAISAWTLKVPELRCITNVVNSNNEQKFELREIIICVDLAGSVIDCPRTNKVCFAEAVNFLL